MASAVSASRTPAGSVVLAIGVLAFLARAGSSSFEKSSGLDVGDCVTYTQFRGAGGPTDSTDCGDSSAVLELASIGSGGDSCPDGNKGDDSEYATFTSRTTTLCFALNLREGSCYKVTSDNQALEPASCERGDRIVSVDKRVDGSTDVGECGPESSQRVALAKPKRVLCLSAAD